jgi:hypothetical protein
MADADIGAAGSVYVGIESAYGTANDPTASGVGVWVPVISESVQYTEPDRYYSEQIRQEAVHSDVKQSYYHVEGDIVMEVDAHFLPYFLYASRHTVTKTGTGPYLYTAVPSKRGSSYPGGTAKGISIMVTRNGEDFLYNGCVVNQWAFTLENGIGRVTMSILGLGENDPATPGTAVPTWIAPSLFGADAHAIYTDAAGLTPAFASPDATFNGYTFTANHNGEPQNRVKRDRSASYIKYGITEVSYDTELDFTSKTEYNNFKNLVFKAIRFESITPGGSGGTWGAATEGYRITAYRTNYATSETTLSGMGDLVMSRTTGRGLGITGGSAYKIECKSTVNIV